MARGCKTSKVLLGEMVAAVSRAQLSPHVGAATGIAQVTLVLDLLPLIGGRSGGSILLRGNKSL